jgi:hypothetical protein
MMFQRILMPPSSGLDMLCKEVAPFYRHTPRSLVIQTQGIGKAVESDWANGNYGETAVLQSML